MFISTRSAILYYFLQKTFLILMACLCLTLFIFPNPANAMDEENFAAEIEEPGMEDQHGNTLKGGWYDYEPYQYQTEQNGIKSLTGLDYQLMNAFSKEINVSLKYTKVNWNELQQAVKAGEKDFASGVLYTKERGEYAYYSIPYRFTEASFFTLPENMKGLKFESVQDLTDFWVKNHHKIAVVAGFIYANPVINQFVHDPRNKDLVIETKSDLESLDLLLSGRVSGFLSDRIVGTTLIWHSNPARSIVEYRIHSKSPIHLFFSKKTVSKDLVEKYNESIRKVMNSEVYRNIVSWYLYPAIVFQIRDAAWFRFTEIIGIIAFAISGLLIAYREKTTLFGAIILAILPSLGGGLIRDVIFGRNPVGALRSPVYLSTVLITVLLGFIVIKLLHHYKKHHEVPTEIEDAIRKHLGIILTVTDAIGLATFTVVGVMVSLLAKANPLWLWGPFFAFVTGAGGGILRDMISKTRYIEALEGEFYGEIAIIWGFLLSVYILLSTTEAQPEYLGYAIVITILGVFFSRLLVHFLRIPNIHFIKKHHLF